MRKTTDEDAKPVGSLMAGPTLHGRVVEARGVIVRVVGASLRIGERVRLVRPDTLEEQTGEVVGFAPDGALVMPLSGLAGLSDITRVEGCGLDWNRLDATRLQGRILDGLGKPLDGGPPAPLAHSSARFDATTAINPLDRPLIAQPFVTGVRAIDGLLTCGVGQRVGIFATAGGGKSTLLGMIANGAQADAIVIALVGERGREVNEFVHDHLHERERIVVVASTSDRPAAERIRASRLACEIAAALRSQGRHVLLLFDSLTRYARALREVGLAVGEPPVRRGYPPRVFAELPRIVEMGGLLGRGSVTAFFTVLAEDEDLADPIVEEARSLLDGHIQLSSRLGAAGHYPAIDILQSKSRLMTRVAGESHRACAQRVRKWLARYRDVELLLQIGEYRRGSDAASDRAIDRHPAITAFLRQRHDSHVAFDKTIAALQALGEGADTST